MLFTEHLASIRTVLTCILPAIEQFGAITSTLQTTACPNGTGRGGGNRPQHPQRRETGRALLICQDDDNVPTELWNKCARGILASRRLLVLVVLGVRPSFSGSDRVPQPIMPLDLPVKVRSWELTVYPRSYIRRWPRVTWVGASSNVNVQERRASQLAGRNMSTNLSSE